MESTKFNLRESVDNYISLIQNQGALTGSDVRELTDHLLDAIEELHKHGLSEEEAFVIAAKRLGNEEVLTQEYAKVNPSVNTNKVWAYLFLGYNLLYMFFALIFASFGGFYFLIFENFGTSSVSVGLIATMHLLFSCLILFLVSKKTLISSFIDRQVRINPMRIVIISFVPQIALFVLTPLLPITFRAIISVDPFNYALREFRGSIVEFTFYIAVFSILGGILSLIFSISNSGKITLKSLFEKPSILFLVSFGILVELFSTSSRTIPALYVWQNAVVFGLIYAAAAYLITIYNASTNAPKYLVIFALFGFVTELLLGFNKIVENGNYYNNMFFCPALLSGLVLGWWIGTVHRKTKLIPDQT
ncbi:permease prefix domain 1-containing protein [Daejeonella lutea]|uniref:Uncharacterized protein n=1 Tax=Daejeonella lutea TaxID=572036 RepID=A0A1T5EB89_9SPHI|nr:permease prefix domain 1-containing protein [Daejeonella lutea]SKB81089.1 hypothetical protein SAMN05661099_2849 [Daejeonella lutea]